ncbi:MAG: ABC transporter ATP-binding protein [Cytophagales bacterium]|nr:MAG: ABC transporter ATP-binding protein [Cytophagales bacterium]
MLNLFFKRFFSVQGLNNSQEKTPTWRDNLKAFRNLPSFFYLIWQTSPSLTLSNALLRLLKAVLPLALLYVGKLIIDEVLRPTGLLWQWVIVELCLAIFSDILNRAITLLDALLGDLMANESSIKLMQHAARLDLPQFEDATFYDKLERARRQTISRTMLMSQLLAQLQDTITLVALTVGLVLFNPWLILILVIAVVPSFLSENYFNRSSYSLARSWTPERRELDYLRYIGASDETAKEVKIFGISDFLIERFRLLATKFYLMNRQLAIKRALWGSFFNALGNAGYYTAFAYIVYQALIGKISIGDLTFLAGSFRQMQSILQGILARFTSIAESALYLQDFFDFFAMQPLITSPAQPEAMPEILKEGFIFENVGFKYPNTERWAIRNVSFHLKAGEKLALVGENGAGKTTLVKLLARLYDADEGRIFLDGKDIKNYDLKEYREKVGVIFQDYVRFQLNISENIAIGKIEERQNQTLIQRAAQQSLADTVIEKLPEKYQQMLGKRFNNGVELSGGEWQKVAIGRAYMRDAQLVILDEPTAALDARAEYEVFQRFAELTKGKTAVLISHRFSTVRMADRILVLKGGFLQEIGTHEELLANKGLYSELFTLQANGYK